MRIIVFSFICFSLLFYSGCTIIDSNKNSMLYDSPESTITTYFNAYNKKQRAVVADCFYPPEYDFYIPERELIIENYKIKKKIIFDKKTAMEINQIDLGIKIESGDVQLDVVDSLEGQTNMSSYFLRKIDDEWKIIKHYSWEQP